MVFVLYTSSFCAFQVTFVKAVWLKTSSTANAVPLPRSRGRLLEYRSPDGDATGIPRLRATSHGEGFWFAVLHMPRAFSRGEGAELARRMRCHRAEIFVRFSFVSVLFDVQAKQKSSEIYTRLLRIETLLLRTSIFRAVFRIVLIFKLHSL